MVTEESLLSFVSLAATALSTYSNHQCLVCFSKNILLITHYFFQKYIITLLITPTKSNTLLYLLYFFSVTPPKLVIVSFLLKIQTMHVRLYVNVSIIAVVCSSCFKLAVDCFTGNLKTVLEYCVDRHSGFHFHFLHFLFSFNVI